MSEVEGPSVVGVERSSSGYLGAFLRHHHALTWLVDSARVAQHQLHSKLFAIKEPYLMKAERDSMIKLKMEAQEDPSSSKVSIANKKRKITTNGAKKRQKNLIKKATLIEDNLANNDERSMAKLIVERYLNASSSSNLDLLGQIDAQSSESNLDAQLFVNQLFCNRFESLNYRAKLFANPYSNVLRVKFGLSNYLIPPRCSFAGQDSIEGLAALMQHLQSTDSESSRVVCHKNPFIVVMDPAWPNGSVKRKKTYETVSLDYIRKLSREVKNLFDVVLERRSPGVIVAIWTTAAHKEFVEKEMMTLMDLTLGYEFKWHKVTTSGTPVKVHGGAEFLLIAHRIISPCMETPCRGLLVSIPSAIHSHKPQLIPLMRHLYQFEGPVDLREHCHHTTTGPSELMDGLNWLVASEFCQPLCGVEFFARYLSTGFHSVGFESIKLQNEKLFQQVNLKIEDEDEATEEEGEGETVDAEVILEEPSTQAFSGSLSVVSGECEAISEEGSEKKRDLEAFIRYACSVFDTEPVGPEGPPSLTASRQTPTLQVSQD